MDHSGKKIINLINKKIREKSKEEIETKKKIKRNKFYKFPLTIRLIYLDLEKKELMKLKEEIKQIK